MKREVAAAPHRELFTIAVALVAGGIGFSAIIGTWLYFHQTRVFERDTEADRELERSRSALRAIPVLGGKWSYQVENWAVKDQKHMQSGECEIQPDPASRPRSFAFHGTRLKTWDRRMQPRPPAACTGNRPGVSLRIAERSGWNTASTSTTNPLREGRFWVFMEEPRSRPSSRENTHSMAFEAISGPVAPSPSSETESPPPRYHLRLMFEWGGGCLWADDDAARAAFDVDHVEDRLPLSDETRRRLEELSMWHDTSLDWDDPMGPSPWTPDEDQRFDRAARGLLERVRAELGPDFTVDYKGL